MAAAGRETEEAREPELEPSSGGPELELEDHVSQQLICPISHRIMDFPMISPNGHTYDRESIIEWLSRRPVDPLSLTPLVVASLYPNRALQNEITEQLERLFSRAKDGGDRRLAEAALAKLTCVKAAKASAPAGATLLVEATSLDKLIVQCARVATWWSIFAWEQVLVFTTSFGALFCLAVDSSLKFLPAPGARGASRPPQFLSTFIKLAVTPMAVPPKHWRTLERLTIMALRGVLLLPVAPICAALTLGSVLSLTRFAQHVRDTRAVEFERAAQSQWFVRTLHLCNAVTGISSFGLFWRMFKDYRDGRYHW